MEGSEEREQRQGGEGEVQGEPPGKPTDCLWTRGLTACVLGHVEGVVYAIPDRVFVDCGTGDEVLDIELQAPAVTDFSWPRRCLPPSPPSGETAHLLVLPSRSYEVAIASDAGRPEL